MSYILDALKKNKTNSDEDSVPDLSSEHGASGYDYSELEEEKALNRWLWPVLVMVLLLVVAILVFMLLNPSAQQVSEDIVKQPILVNNQIAASAETKQEDALIADDTVITNKPLEVGEPVVSKKEKKDLKVEPSSTEQVTQNTTKSSTKITKADLPQLVYTTHIYATQAKDRFVMLNGRAYAQGDKTVEGITIKEILENDLVVIFKGQEFILPSLEDVNLN
jgi:general secretion pathway protein B